MTLSPWRLSAWAALPAALFISAGALIADAVRVPVLIPCADAPTMAAMLRKFGELQLGTAVDADNTPMVLSVNPETRTFTVLIRQRDGLNCILAAGHDFKLTGKLIAGRDI